MLTLSSGIRPSSSFGGIFHRCLSMVHPFRNVSPIAVRYLSSNRSNPSSSSSSSSSSSGGSSSSHSNRSYHRPRPPPPRSTYDPRPAINAKDPLRIVYGLHACSTVLLTRSRHIHKAYISITNDHDSTNLTIQKRILPLLEKYNVHIIRIDRRSLDELTNNGVHQGIMFETDLLSTLPLPEDIATTILRTASSSSASAAVTSSKVSDNVVLAHQQKIITPNRPPLLVALDEITDPMNIGAILRSSLLLGADGILISNRNTASIGLASISKASAGALEIWSIRKRLFTTPNMLTTLESCRNREWKIIGTVAPSTPKDSSVTTIIPLSQLYNQVILSTMEDTNNPTTTNTNSNNNSSKNNHQHNNGLILVMGNEGSGLRTKIQNMCDILTYIPMYNPLSLGVSKLLLSSKVDSNTMEFPEADPHFHVVESLNVSTAAAILLYHLRLGTV